MQSGVSLITANNFMTNDENGVAFATPYANMINLLGVSPVGFDSVTSDAVNATSAGTSVIGYGAGELIQTYNANATSKVGTAYYTGRPHQGRDRGDPDRHGAHGGGPAGRDLTTPS